jgi:hypothetical protein
MLTDFLASFSKLALNISCIECSGPRIPELTSLMSTLEASEAVTDFANGLFGFVTKLIEGEFLRVAVDRALNDAPKKCPHSPGYDANFADPEYQSFDIAESEDSVSFVVALFIVAACLVCVVAATFIFTIAVCANNVTTFLTFCNGK